jgi:hypothetical protein
MSDETKKNESVHGYKVFRPDWTCSPCGNTKQYTCPGKFEEEGEIEVCGNGMHFCQKAANCFNYYGFDSKNKVAEVIAYGDVVTDGDKSCTNKLEIVRELSWKEVLDLVNTGNDCTGLKNTGNENAGNLNSGDYNTGDFNTGDDNRGYWNSGNQNSGHYNTGSQNSGNKNTGSYNSGGWNSGDCNSGDFNIGYENSGSNNTGCKNTGYYNTGDENIGNCNTGDNNTGDLNSGHFNLGAENTGNRNLGDSNSGDWNKSSHNSGCFNTEEHKIIMFNKPSNMTYTDWQDSDACALLDSMPDVSTKWEKEACMTDDEKTSYPTYKTTGGYLKVINNIDGRQKWWNDLSDSDKAVIKAIPNFDPNIFFECTGIKVN